MHYHGSFPMEIPVHSTFLSRGAYAICLLPIATRLRIISLVQSCCPAGWTFLQVCNKDSFSEAQVCEYTSIRPACISINVLVISEVRET